MNLCKLPEDDSNYHCTDVDVRINMQPAEERANKDICMVQKHIHEK